jgi:hypothetical protein
MTFHTALGYAPINYTCLVGDTLVGYYLKGHQTRAVVHQITPLGNVPLGECSVSFPHVNSVREYVERVSK